MQSSISGSDNARQMKLTSFDSRTRDFNFHSWSVLTSQIQEERTFFSSKSHSKRLIMKKTRSWSRRHEHLVLRTSSQWRNELVSKREKLVSEQVSNQWVSSRRKSSSKGKDGRFNLRTLEDLQIRELHVRESYFHGNPYVGRKVQE